jgi:hypothetical protein
MRMNCLTLLLTGMITVSDATSAGDSALDDIASLRWNYRVILVHAREPLASRAVVNLHEFAAGIEERDIAWFVLDDTGLRSNYDGTLGETLRERLMTDYFSPVPSEPVVLLIGKDGGVKSRSSDLDLEATFGLIDQMPMRRQEMRRQRDGLE